jgi:hypothetical protein
MTVTVVTTTANIVEIVDDQNIVVISSNSNAYDHFSFLVDVPNTMVGASLKYLRVNIGETALEYASSVAPTSITIPAGSSFKFYASDGITLVAEITEAGDLNIKGRIGAL